jgi:hypothetical protein
MANETDSGKHENALDANAVTVTIGGTTETLQAYLSALETRVATLEAA